MTCGIDDNDGGVGGGQRIDNASEGLETTMEAVRIQGRQRRRLRRRNDRPKELATTTEASEEEDETEVLTTTTEALAEE